MDQAKAHHEVIGAIARQLDARTDLKWKGTFNCECRDANGNVKWKEEITNSLTYQGSEYMLKKALDSTSTRVANGGWYYALYTAAITAAKTAATATTSELGSVGYARLATDAGAVAFDQNPNYWRATFGSKTFSPGANDWASCWGLGIVDAAAGNTGTCFLSFAQFSTARDLAPNDTLTVQYKITLSS